MATYTTNYNLEKPDSTDDFKDFRASYNGNMDIIDQNLGGGGGGGHTIIDENDQTMTQRTGLQFTGNVEVTDDSVNDKTVVDMPYEVVHLTQAQYDALPNTKLTDGKIYCITDVYSGGSDKLIGLGDCYSTMEKVVGCWTDGKPLYQKTINFGALPNNTSKSVAHNISDLGYVANIKCVAENPVSHIYLPIPFSHRLTIGNQIQLEVSSTDVSIYTALDRTSFSNCYVTLQYTKTTDTAGSGDWTPSGVLAVHYSTNEQVIGTWMGEPLYQKTVFNTGSDITANAGAWTVICSESWVTNVKTIISGNLTRQGTVGDTLITPVEFTVNSGAIKINPFRNLTYKANGYFTIQYTKTS